MAFTISFLRTEAPASHVTPSASIWRRAKARIVSTARAVVASARTAVRAVKRVITRAARKIVARAVMTITRHARRVVPVARKAWRVALRPFLKLRVVAYLVVGLVATLAAAPAVTLLVFLVAGLLTWGLHAASSRLSPRVVDPGRLALRLVEGVARVIAYLIAATLTVATCLVFPIMAVVEVVELVLRLAGFRGSLAVAVSTALFFLLSGNWMIAMSNLALLALVSRLDDADVIEITKDHVTLRSIDVQTSFHDLAPCTACDLSVEGVRLFVGRHQGLCIDCHGLLTEEDLLEAVQNGRVSREDISHARDNGVTVPARVILAAETQPVGRLVELTVDETAKLSARLNSQEDLDHVHWTETAWWFDARGTRHPRCWSGFAAGSVVARVEYVHSRRKRGYVTSVLDFDGEFRRLTRSATQARAFEEAARELTDLATRETDETGSAMHQGVFGLSFINAEAQAAHESALRLAR